MLLATSAYVGGFLALGMFGGYYLLPAYAFGVCGVAGVAAGQLAPRVKVAIAALASLFCVNALPVAISDLQAQRSIANNHYEFVQSLSEWLAMNPLPGSKPRNLVLAGVSPGNGVEILVSLRIFLESFGIPVRSFEIKATEPSDNPRISNTSGFTPEVAYIPKEQDLVIYNPFQSKVVKPPLSMPSYREIYRSGSEWALPRWTGWNWVTYCVLRPRDCIAIVEQSMRYTGYSAMLLIRRPAAVAEPIAIRDFSFRTGPLRLASRIRAGATQRLEALIENTGTEIWPANGTLGPLKVVNVSYRWLDEKGQMILEGDRAALPEPIQPNDIVKVSLVIKAPARPGKYRFVIGPVQEGGTWFIVSEDARRRVEVY